MKDEVSNSYPIDATNRVKRRAERGAYDHATVHRLLDAATLCHVAYVVDGQPICTPTLFWRDGTRVYWHGSNASRMLQSLASDAPACLTVTHFDALVLARCGFNHSVDYRCVMLFGHVRLLTARAEKAQALRMMVDRLFPGRTDQLRQSTEQEINATSVVMMEIERASAKIRARGVADDEEDYALPIYAERLPIRQLVGEAGPCPRLPPGVHRPSNLDGYRANRPLEEALSEARHRAYPGADRD